MTAPRWMRPLPGRPTLVLLLGIAFFVFVAIVFANLAIERSTAQADRDRAKARVEQLHQQNTRLQQELGRSQDGQQLAYWAYRLFGLAPPGTKVIEGEPQTAAGTAGAEQASVRKQPFWVGWWQTLTNP